ncbi:MAG: hypothetical protein KJ556_20060 [Gammaproteobacteria bacterium]|nr:hypothetical protein [Gammaproteobacteria bacterium]
MEDNHTRIGQLAQDYKFRVKRIMDAIESRYDAPCDRVVREAVMVEMSVFFNKAKALIEETPVYEQAFYAIEDICQSARASGKRSGS